MSYNSAYTSASLAHVCSNRPADIARIVSYIRRQYVRTVPNVDIVGNSKCHTRHLATGGVARFNYVLVTNSNPVTTCASDGRVNPYPNRGIQHTVDVSGTGGSSSGNRYSLVAVCLWAKYSCMEKT
jgi:hypothetical protein